MKIKDFIWYRIFRKIDMLPRHIKWGIQRLFRGYGDPYLWNFYSACIKDIYPKFKAFVRMEKHGLASCYFDDPNKIEHTDEDFKKAFENYNDILDKILFAFEFILYDDCCMSRKWQKEFEKKYGNPFEEIEENKHPPLKATIVDDETGGEKEDYLFDGNPIYYNSKMLDEFHERKIEGLKLFGEYFFTFWD